jgi:hypothetical protein
MTVRDGPESAILRPRFEPFQPLDKSVGQRFIEAIQSPYPISQRGAHTREIGTSFEVVIPVHQGNYPLSSKLRLQASTQPSNFNFVSKYNPTPKITHGAGAQGHTHVGVPDPSIANGQTRLLVAWNRMPRCNFFGALKPNAPRRVYLVLLLMGSRSRPHPLHTPPRSGPFFVCHRNAWC